MKGMPAVQIKLYHTLFVKWRNWHYTAICMAANSSVIDNCSQEDNINVMYLKELLAAAG
jgi:hypothetical protein